MKTTAFKLKELILKVEQGHFSIPCFQRSFVWNIPDVKLLIDSFIRKYPIGTILILEKGGELRLADRTLDAEINSSDTLIDESDDTKNDSQYYVLDGQQRLTSIARVFLNASNRNTFYFNLYEIYRYLIKETTSPEWIVSKNRKKKDDFLVDGYLLRSDLAISTIPNANGFMSDIYIPEFVDNYEKFGSFEKSKKYEIQAMIKSVFEELRAYEVPAIILEKADASDSICRIFETINTTGKKLTTFEIAVASYYPFPLKEKIDELKNDTKIISKDGFDISGEQFLHIIALKRLKENNQPLEVTRKILLNMNNGEIFEKWETELEAAKNAIEKSCNWLNKDLGVKIAPPRIIAAISTTLMFFPDALKKDDFRLALRKWYFCIVLGEMPTLNNFKVGELFASFCSFLEGAKHEIPCESVYLTPQDLIKTKAGNDATYQAVLAIINSCVTKDIKTGGDLIINPVELHHIFPQALKKTGVDKDLIKSVVNLIPVTMETNRAISDKNPELYFKEIIGAHTSQGTLSSFNDLCKIGLIPYSPLDSDFIDKVSVDNIRFFLEKRAEIIIDKIKGIVGNAWNESLSMNLNG